MNKIKVGVIGIGNLGQHHVRVYSQMEDVQIVGIADINQKKLDKISQQYSVQKYLDYRELLDKVDAVSIVVPTLLHYCISKDFLFHKVHCFIEKPITVNINEAQELIDLSRQNNIIIQVGHIERFNPAIIEAQQYIKKPKFIEAYRLSPFDSRTAEVGVILDLMIHDLDIILFLVNSKVKKLEAYGAKVFSQNEDIVKCRLYFENGCVADLTASRVSTGRYRKIRIFQEDSYISIDYIGQGLKIYRKKKHNVNSMDDIENIRPKLIKVEQLKLELEHFINCIKEGKKPIVTGEQGRNAVEVAMEILKELKIM